VIGIKCAVSKARLLKEFFSQLASPMSYEQQIGIYVPAGAVHILGTSNYAAIIQDHNLFLNSVITIPLGDFPHATLSIPFSLDPSTDINQMTLPDFILNQEWCISVDKTKIDNKVMVTTTKPHLETAQTWFNTTFPALYKQYMGNKLDVTTLQH